MSLCTKKVSHCQYTKVWGDVLQLLGRGHTQNFTIFHFFHHERKNFHFRSEKLFFGGHTQNFSLHFFTPPLLPPWPPFSSSNPVGNHIQTFSSFPRPAIGSKELFAIGPHAAIKQQHITECTIHKEPAMLQMPSFKHLVYGLQGPARQSIDPEPLGESVRTGWWKV